ncbi:MAG: glycosyltransferase family 2 protein [Paludibacteraceae bacterium]|nr:glycosyltransferase family 2 protein [Paludibacteraceae bacterium]
MYSVIIPVYNVKDYLPRCLDSLLLCISSDFELLLVDDGSTDGSGSICDYYSDKDVRVRTFHKQNGGVSSARNVGLEHANGEWLMFVDSDDWVSDDFFEIADSSADIIERPYSRVDEDGKVISRYCPSSNRIIEERDDLFDFFVNKRINVLWNKVIRRNLIADTRFNESVSIGEDFLFYLEILKRVKRYEFSEKGEYFYLHRTGSAMSNIEVDKRIRILFENMGYIKDILRHDDFGELRNGILCVTYFPVLCLVQKNMSGDLLLRMKSWVSEMASGDFKFVPLLLRIKVILKNLILHIKW